MAKKLFLLDGMALVYRAHFAFIHRPIVNSQGVNTSALLGFTNTLLDIIETYQPTHLGVAFDTPEPTVRHEEYPAYKAQREAMPEDLSDAIPHVFRMVEAFNIPVIKLPGYEADDLIGTIAKRAEKEGFETYMVTPDKDFAQLVSEKIFHFRPGRKGDGVEIMGVAEVLEKWGIKRIDQVIEIQGLMGDAVDNIPGVPGIGPKTAQKLIAEYDTIENLLQNTHKLKGKQKERLEENKEQALLSKKLARIIIDAPAEVSFEELEIKDPNVEALKELCTEFELNAIGRKIIGGDFKAGRGGGAKASDDTAEGDGGAEEVAVELKTIADLPHDYQLITKPADRQKLIAQLGKQKLFCFDLETTGLDPRSAQVLGLAFSFKAGSAYYVSLPYDADEAKAALEEFRPLLEDTKIEKIGHNLKYDLSVLSWQGFSVKGPLFDTMLAHSLIEPDQRHKMDYISEFYLAYTPIPISKLIGEKGDEQLGMALVPLEELADYAAEDADVTWQLYGKLKPLLKEHGQEKVFFDVEAPLIPVLVAMEKEGVRIDAEALRKFSGELAVQIAAYQKEVFEIAGQEFNLASPKQLGEILFDKLKLVDKPKKTKTGQYKTNEQTLTQLAPMHAIVQRILDFRQASKLKSTYADSLPNTIWSRTGRVHTTYNQAVTVTGRLQSQNPNLQNIPIRTAMGREIRKAFVPRDEDHVLLSADYSQIELRIIASICKDPGLIEAFEQGHDIHSATAAKVFHVPLEEVDSDQRRTAKMVNFGLAYGMSAFGLSQRLGISRREAADIMEEYFRQFPSLEQYMSDTTQFAREHGYVETLTGRRRYLRDINSRNGTVRKQAERNAVNMPVQGTAADMIKIAMSRIFDALNESGLKTKMILQVHDELVFDVPSGEVDTVKPMVEQHMREAFPMKVPIVVEIGTGQTWLEAH